MLEIKAVLFVHGTFGFIQSPSPDWKKTLLCDLRVSVVKKRF